MKCLKMVLCQKAKNAIHRIHAPIGLDARTDSSRCQRKLGEVRPSERGLLGGDTQTSLSSMNVGHKASVLYDGQVKMYHYVCRWDLLKS